MERKSHVQSIFLVLVIGPLLFCRHQRHAHFGPSKLLSPKRSVYEDDEYDESPKPEEYGSIDEHGPDYRQIRYDSTGMFHWCPARPMEDVLMVSKSRSWWIWERGLRD